MNTFLKSTIQTIWDDQKENVQNCIFIIPNKRGAIHIQKYLSDYFLNKPFFAPQILTINEWVNQNTKFKILNQTELIFVFYKIYVQIEKENSESFDSFLKWGKLILADFDEIDRHLVEPDVIFKDIRNIKDIENWSFNTTENLSKSQEKFISLWDKLAIYYKELNQYLKENNLTYQGKAYKNFYLNLKQNELNNNEFYYFIGFNALSLAEEEIIFHLKNKRKANVFFDVDSFYVENNYHEAGHFYRKYENKWGLNNNLENLIANTPKNIEIIETSQAVAQAKITGNILKNFTNDEIKNTAIILADESLLIPISKSLPQTIENANITMGYPIKYSHLKSLIDIVFDIQNSYISLNTKNINHKLILKFIHQSFIKDIINEDENIFEFENYIINKNIIFVNHKELNNYFKNSDLLINLIKPWNDNFENTFIHFKAFNQILSEKFKTKNSIEIEILYQFNKSLLKFEKLWKKYNYTLSIKSFKNLFYQFWQSENLSFLGNPIEELQIMGILETRTIDFQNIIILSLNENILPKSNFSNSLIPRDVKIQHLLPIEQDKDAIFAHHFYRLLHRSKNVFLIYNSSSDGFGTNEKSRFVSQIENEFKDLNPNIKIKFKTFIGKNSNAKSNEVTFKQNDEIRKKLDVIFENGLSPSALNTLINCPLDFYYTYVLGMKELIDVEENIESSTFGTFIHNVLEKIYRTNFLDKNKPVDKFVLANEKKNLTNHLSEEYNKIFKSSDYEYGQNKLSFEISLNFLTQFIDEQIKELEKIDFPIYIKHLEYKLDAEFKWEINGGIKSIKFKGLADRIEQFGSVYRIIDYKSGKCDANKLKINSKSNNFENELNNRDKNYVRQLLLYSLMFKESFPDFDKFNSGIISMINLKYWYQQLPIEINDGNIETLKNDIKSIIENLYSDDFLFKHNKDSKFCEHCGK